MPQPRILGQIQL